MSLCSAHREPVPGCKLCETTPEDIFGKDAWAEASARADAAGLYKCQGWKKRYPPQDPDDLPSGPCGYTYYLTVDSCPFCGTPYPPRVGCVHEDVVETCSTGFCVKCGSANHGEVRPR